MKFIFPQNYNSKFKILGFIEYQSAVLDILWISIVLIFINILFNSLNVKLFLFIVLVLPVIILSIVGINGESIIDVMIYIGKFMIKQKIILYDKK